jgi:molecular chaperone GrpE
MKHKEKQEPKEEKTSQSEGGIADFYGLLESLLPLRSDSLQDLRAAMENCKKRSEETLPSDKNKADYALELEKEKTKCLLELYKITLDQYLRISADYANFQKRVPRQVADAIAYEKEKIIRTLLPALDNFESALGRLQNAQPAENAESVVKGIKITYDQMLDILRSHGVEQIKAVGEKFEPALHEAITQRDEPGKEEGVVLEEFAKGYKLNGRAIRPSKVIVNKVTSEKASGQKETPAEGESKQTTGADETTDTE